VRTANSWGSSVILRIRHIHITPRKTNSITLRLHHNPFSLLSFSFLHRHCSYAPPEELVSFTHDPKTPPHRHRHYLYYFTTFISPLLFAFSFIHRPHFLPSSTRSFPLFPRSLDLGPMSGRSFKKILSTPPLMRLLITLYPYKGSTRTLLSRFYYTQFRFSSPFLIFRFRFPCIRRCSHRPPARSLQAIDRLGLISIPKRLVFFFLNPDCW